MFVVRGLWTVPLTEKANDSADHRNRKKVEVRLDVEMADIGSTAAVAPQPPVSAPTLAPDTSLSAAVSAGHADNQLL